MCGGKFLKFFGRIIPRITRNKLFQYLLCNFTIFPCILAVVSTKLDFGNSLIHKEHFQSASLTCLFDIFVFSHVFRSTLGSPNFKQVSKNRPRVFQHKLKLITASISEKKNCFGSFLRNFRLFAANSAFVYVLIWRKSDRNFCRSCNSRNLP